MTDLILTLVCDSDNEGGPLSEPIVSTRHPLGAAKAILYAIARWCLAAPKLPAHAPDDLSQGCANARAARIRRAQDAVDELLAAPSPEEASFARFRGAGGYATEAAWL
jgi:hypothetical protein